MMGTDLDVSYLEPEPTVDELMALGRGTAWHKFKQVPAEQQCSCAASRALGHANVGSELPGGKAVPDHERLVLGVGRSWRVTGITKLDDGVTVEEFRAMIGCLHLADTLARL